MPTTPDQDLIELAAAHGVATEYEDWQGRRVGTDPDVIRAVLRLLDVDADNAAAVRRELAEARARQTTDALRATVVVRPGELWRGPDATTGDGTLAAGQPVGLPLGYHRIDSGRTLIVAPRRLPVPAPAWGWMLQLYALHSARSWGMGDLADLGTFADWAAGTGDAGLILLNPLHAVNTVPQVQPSPYSPSSRRFANPIYLAVAETQAYRRAPEHVRAAVDRLRPDAGTPLIRHDDVWRAKLAAFELLHPYAEVGGIGSALEGFAAFCALSEVHGPDWRQWPVALRRPGAAAIEAAGERTRFHAWLQQECDRQLASVQDRLRAAGMPVGLVLDLAVGVDPGGADGWTLQDVLAAGVTAGAPPDAFNQHGQNWGVAAWRPDRLAATGYAGFRDVVRAMVGNAGGVRVDHVMGLWRLWWVPPGASPDQGTYVSYDSDAMLAVLMLEAVRAGAVVVAEDLGTVEPRVSKALHEANILGSEVLWFARDFAAPDQPFLPPAQWPPSAMASVSTHDLPTAAGLLTGDHVRVRAELGLLGDAAGVAAETDRAAADRSALVALLEREGVVRPGAGDEELVVGMHRLLAASPCRFLLASPYDVLGETRQPNLPGTVDEYPNWRIPLPEPVERLVADPRMAEVASILGSARPRDATG